MMQTSNVKIKLINNKCKLLLLIKCPQLEAALINLNKTY